MGMQTMGSEVSSFDNFVPEFRLHSPGRINLIGEHVDYNMGLVMPAAIDKTMLFEFQSQPATSLCQVLSVQMGTVLDFDVNALPNAQHPWENYILGVIHEFHKRGIALSGFRCRIDSSIPSGSGVSSSAALECGLAYGLNHMFGAGLTKKQLISLCRDAEHHYVGTQCGIMDQYASVMGEEGHFIFLDCATETHELVPFDMPGYELLLLNTKVTHTLADGAYNERRQQCASGVATIAEQYPEVRSLRDVDGNMLARIKERLDATIYRRCAFVVAEIARVTNAKHYMDEGDIHSLGRLLYESHEGLQVQYEVSCKELDFLVQAAKEKPFIAGARMVGGGFGGCTYSSYRKCIPRRI